MKKPLTLSAAAVLALSFNHPALAQASGDVDVFSTTDAEDMLADHADDECPVRLENGECARTSSTRGFSFAPKKGASSDTGASGLTARSSGNARVITTRPTSRTTVKPTATARTGRAREVPLQFALGSYELSPQSRANLANLATVLNSKEHKAKKIRITGHTDKSGTLEQNQILSKKRAEAAADYLASVKVDRARIVTEGRAFEDTLPGLSEYNPRNRRVEVERIE